MDFLHVVCVSLVLWAQVDAQFNQGSCVSLEPIFGNIQNTAPPFLVAATSNSYTPGGPPVQVFIASTTPGMQTTSVIIQARAVGSTVPVGSFVVPTGYNTINCGGSAGGTLTSSDTSPKSLPIPLSWNPPAVGVGDITFFVSFVDNNNNVWTQVASTGSVTGPLEATALSIDTCPTAVVNGNTATFAPPACRRDNNFVGVSTCSSQSGSFFQNGDTTVTCTCSNQGEIDSCQFTVTVSIVVTPCAPSPCQNGGQCFEIPSLPSGFFCSCPGIFTGATCQLGGGSVLTIEPCAPTVNNAGSTYFWTTPSCRRDGITVGLSICSPPSGGTFSGPNNPVTCTCNNNGDQASCPFNINAGGLPTAVCLNNPCAGVGECREADGALAGYTCHITTGIGCTDL